MHGPRWRRRSEAHPTAKKSSSFDTWLTRIGAGSAIIVAIFGTLTFFYTVVPIWKANLLEEQLSKKQIELNRMQEQVEATYARVRTAAIREYVWQLGAKCTGLLRQPETKPRGYGRTSGWVDMLPVDSNGCFKAPPDSKHLEQVRPADQALLLERLSEVAALIEEDRVRTIDGIKTFTERAMQDPTLLPPLEERSFTKAFADLLNSPEEELLGSRLDQAQRNIAMRWGDRTRERLAALTGMEFHSEE